jgi:hypothetical protein
MWAPASSAVLGEGDAGDLAEDFEEGGLVQAVEVAAEHGLGGAEGVLEGVVAVYEAGDLLGEAALCSALFWRCGVLVLDGLNRGVVEEGEVAQEAAGVGVGLVNPELVELVGGGALGVEPDVAALRLAELGAVALGDEGEREAEGVLPAQTAGEVHARDDIAPLIAAADLEAAIERVVEVEEVVGLEQAVGELGVGDAVVAIFKARAYGVAGEHDVDGEMLADVAQEVEQRQLAEPVRVVGHDGGIRAVEGEEALELGADPRTLSSTCSMVWRVRSAVLPLGRR